MPASPQPLSVIQALAVSSGRGLAHRRDVVRSHAFEPCPERFRCSLRWDEPDYSEHIVNSAWFRGMDGQHSEREDPLSGGISLGHIALSFHIPLFS